MGASLLLLDGLGRSLRVGKAVKKLKQELSEVVHTIAEVVGIIA